MKRGNGERNVREIETKSRARGINMKTQTTTHQSMINSSTAQSS